ncbi:protein kinase [Micromonospora sp. NPDC050686]|uniref:serine/threonine-protein kinase n=1 Tax=Micromonospora sp. NPDC050686 TaxID=3154631 RepID=UPI0033D3048C
MAAALDAGDLLARRYRLIDQIGAGGMSVIWRARDEVLDRVVALKVLAPSLAADARFRDLVREEARSAAQLVHPHVTSVHDYGEALAPDGSITAFVVMELLTGEALERRLTEGPLPWPAAVELGAQVAEALAAAHRLGVVHRDITPANVMLTSVGAKVLDFGIATQIGAPDDDEDGGTFGTPAYVAPERLDGVPAQPAADVYSLGVLLYQTLTGRVPYPADTWEQLAEALRQGAPEPPDVPGLPPAVAGVCARCLVRDPHDRPTARQVAAALRDQLLPADPQAATMLAPTITLPLTPRPAADAPPADGPDPDRSAAPGSQPDAPPPTGRRWARPALVAGVGLAAALALAAPALRPDRIAPVVAPTAGPATASPAPAATSTAPAGNPPPATAPRPSTVAPLPGPEHLVEVAARVEGLIGDGVSTGAIRDDVGLDLRNELRNLTTAVGDGRADPAFPVARLREKVTVRLREGAITPEYARQLDTAIAALGAARV